MKIDRRTFLVGATGAATAALFRPALVQAAEPLNVSVVLGNAIHWVQFVAADKGFYKEANFAPKILPLHSSAQSIQMALSGGFQIATSQPETFIAAVVRGATQLAAMSAPMNKNDWVLVGGPDIKTTADLKGKEIGLSGLGNAEQSLTERLLTAQGLKPGDYSFVVAGTSPSKVAAVQAGGVAAAVLFQPSAQVAIRHGLHALARYDQLRAYPTILYVVNETWAAAGGAGKRASGALQKAHAWLWDSANHQEALHILEKYTKRDAAVLESVYRQYFVDPKIYSKSGAIDQDGLQAVLNDMAHRGSVFKKAPPASKFLLPHDLGGRWT